MNIKTVCGILLIAACALYADINSVTVPGTMLHPPDAGTQLGFSGKVEYTLTAGGYDTIFVTLSILPSGGGTPLTLTEVSGDVGPVRIVNPNAPDNHVIFFQCSAPANTQYIARITAVADSSASKKAVENYIATMSKVNKATLMGGGGDGFEGLGAGPIPEIYMSDGPHGVRPQSGAQATLYPCCSGEASTWDTALAFIQGASKGEEFRALGKNCSLGPALDLVYHPQGGRASEYYGEDPYESGHMAGEDCMGLQSKGVAATIKHYACNNKENNRGTLSANMSERSLREIYLMNWKPCIVRGNDGCWGIMGAYNQVNHLVANQGYCNQNKYLMTDVLRNEWGYKFMVMTDWGANMDFTQAIRYGTDIDMPNPDTYNLGSVSGQPDSLVNMHARRIIYEHEMVGDLVAGYNATAFTSTFKGTTHRAVARQVGTAAIVLAKNDGNILPIPKTGKTIALTGPASMLSTCRTGPGGSSSVNPAFRVDPKTGITQLLGGTGGYPTIPGASTITTDLNAADYILVFVGVTGETEGADRPNLAVQPGDGDAAVQTALAATNGTTKTIVVFTGGSAASAGYWSTAPAIVFAFYPGQEQGYCIADVLFGNYNPSGKLPVTFPVDATQLPNFNLVNNIELNYPASDTAHGYFRMDKNKWTPLFHFGHGLSYTTFEYSNLQVFPTTISAGDRVHVRVTVKNTGDVAGKETAELYLSMPAAAGLPVHVQDLRGFQKVPLDPTQTLASGASQTVDFILAPEDMRVFNPNGADYNGTGTWQINPGTYGVRVGTSSQVDLQPTMSGSFTVQ
ncbi:MAG TPA: glycoside hydrolase family 3 C-terminal domain-containing protein [Chitinivibrionales bacterium]|nr:glycoside hydrolase family 3 C-terminal domain-containing protein [Chitinivibrionales bacterium]